MDEHHRHFADDARSFTGRSWNCVYQSDEDLSGMYWDWIILLIVDGNADNTAIARLYIFNFAKYSVKIEIMV